MTHSLCHVLFVTHKLRTVHEMRDTQCHTCALNNFVVSSRNTLENFFWTFQNFRHDMARITSPDLHRHAHCHEFFPHWHAELRILRKPRQCEA